MHNLCIPQLCDVHCTLYELHFSSQVLGGAKFELLRAFNNIVLLLPPRIPLSRFDAPQQNCIEHILCSLICCVYFCVYAAKYVFVPLYVCL